MTALATRLAPYSGRLNDLCILHGATGSGLRQLDVSLGGNAICTGAQKLAQKVLLAFMTELGSEQFDPDRGTGFMTSARQGRLNSDTAVQMEFNAAASRALRQMETDRELDDRDIPDDEIPDKLELVTFSLAGGRLAMTLKITSVAADARPIILPLELPLTQ